MPVMWWPVDRYTAVHQTLADSIDVVDGVCEMAEVSSLIIVFGVPVVSEFDLCAFIAGCRQEYQCEPALIVLVTFDFLEPSLSQ